MTLKNEKSAAWPYGSILLWGTFGTGSPAGKRYHRRCSAALGLMVAGVMLAALVPSPYRHGVAFVPGLAFAFIAFEMWRYVDSLDELERRLQVDAMAWTYTVAMGLAMLLGGLGMFLGWNLNPMGLILMEPLRAWRLHVLVRRFK